MLETTRTDGYNAGMTPEFNSHSTDGGRIDSVQRQMFADIYTPVTEEQQQAPLLYYLQTVYDSRNQDPTERAEMSQLRRAARYITQSHGAEPSPKCQEFFSGELLAAELVANLTGSREGTGMLAWEGLQDPLTEVSLLPVKEITTRLAYLEYPSQYDDLLTCILTEHQQHYYAKHGSYDTSNAYSSFLDGYRFIINQACLMGYLSNPSDIPAPEIDPEKQARYNYFGMPERENLPEVASIPTAAFLHMLLDNSFEKSDYMPLDDTIDAIVAQHLRIKEALIKTKARPHFDTDGISKLHQSAKDQLNHYVEEGSLLTAGDLISSRGNIFYLEQKGRREVRHFSNQTKELRGEFMSMDVIVIADDAMLQKHLERSPIDPNDPSTQRLFIPAVRLKSPSIIQRDENNTITGIVHYDDREVVIPLVYKRAELRRFESSLEATPDGDSPK